LFDAATVSASSAAASLPASYLQNEQRQKVWRSTSLAGQYIRIDLGAVELVDSLVLINHNLTVSGEVTIKAGTSPGDDSILSETHNAWLPLWGFGDAGFGEHGYGGYPTDAERATYYPAGPFRWLYLTAGQTRARYWEIDFSDAGNADGYIELGRILIGTYQESTRKVGLGMRNRPEDPSKLYYSLGGQVWVDEKTKYRVARVPFKATPGTETWGLWYALFLELGVGRSFAVDLLPDVSNVGMRLHNQFYGHIPEGGIPDIEVPFMDRGNLTLELRESL